MSEKSGRFSNSSSCINTINLNTVNRFVFAWYFIGENLSVIYTADLWIYNKGFFVHNYVCILQMQTFADIKIMMQSIRKK